MGEVRYNFAIVNKFYGNTKRNFSPLVILDICLKILHDFEDVLIIVLPFKLAPKYDIDYEIKLILREDLPN